MHVKVGDALADARELGLGDDVPFGRAKQIVGNERKNRLEEETNEANHGHGCQNRRTIVHDQSLWTKIEPISN